MSAVRCFTCARKGFAPRARETRLFVETMGGGRKSISGVKVQRLTNNFFILQQFHIVDKMFLSPAERDDTTVTCIFSQRLVGFV